MDLGIAGRKALICASSSGLGRGCALALAAEGVDVTLNGRNRPALDATAEVIRLVNPDVTVSIAHCDITTAEGRDEALRVCPQPDILITNSGGQPPGDFRDWRREDWLRALNNHMLTPIDLIRATVDGMRERSFGRIVNIMSFTVRIPDPVLMLSNGPRSGLASVVSALSKTVAKDGVTINNLLPGTFLTGRTSQNPLTAHLRSTEQTGRLGNAEEFGKLCAFLCSAHAGYVVGQNILIDGGRYRGNF